MSYRERFLVATDNVKLEEIPVYILGVGAVGAHVAVNLTKIGFRQFELCDMDVVTSANVGVQIYGKE